MFAKNAAIPPAQLPGTFRAADDHPPMTDENGVPLLTGSPHRRTIIECIASVTDLLIQSSNKLPESEDNQLFAR
jgi:hypothetical protein